MKPRVSVIIPAYNHEAFVAECVHSVLHQTGVDLEVIVCDDASTDGTLAVLQSIHDPRLKVLALSENAGASAAARQALALASGDFIARLGSDDVCLPGRLALQAAYLESHPEVGGVLGQPEFYDENSQVIQSPSHFGGLFTTENRSRQEWLRHFFEHDNCLCMPSSMMRRNVSLSLPPPRDTFRYLPDFEYWVRFSLEHELHILPDKVVGFRVRPGGANLSGPGLEKVAERMIEELAIWRYFLDPRALEALGLPSGVAGRLQLAQRAFAIGGRSRRLFALLTVMETDLSGCEEAERFRLLQQASVLLRGSDGLGLLELARLRDSRENLRRSRDKAREKVAKLEAELKGWRESWGGRFLGRWMRRRPGRSSKNQEHL